MPSSCNITPGVLYSQIFWASSAAAAAPLPQIMSIDNQPALAELSPLAVAHAWSQANLPVSSYMPCTLFIHGTSDKTVPFVGSLLLHEALEEAGVNSACK